MIEVEAKARSDLKKWRQHLLGYGLDSHELAGFEAAVINHMHLFICHRMPLPPAADETLRLIIAELVTYERGWDHPGPHNHDH